MDSVAAHAVINEVGDIRHRVRRDLRATSVPLLVFGAITLIDAVLRAGVDPIGNAALLVLAPVGFFVVALYYRRRESVIGIGGRTRPYVVAALVTLLCLPLLLAFGAYALVGVALLVIAVRQRNLYLGVWAIVFGVVGGLESIYLISNRLYSVDQALGLWRAQDGYFSWAPSLEYGALGVVLISAGLYAHRREVAGP
jgi:hypothetical protein